MTTHRTRPQQATAAPEQGRGLLFKFVVTGALMVMIIFMVFLVKNVYQIRVDAQQTCINSLPLKAATPPGACP